MQRQFSPLDKLVNRADQVLGTVTGHARGAARPSPAAQLPDDTLSPAEKTIAKRMMRVNHCGEVCAQALYAGQAVTSRDSRTAASMRQAAREEQDHLVWCEARLGELDGSVSKLNPIFYAMSFSAGALAGLLGNRINLGFLAATEEQVTTHLDEHLAQLPDKDERSRAILTQMREDEQAHGKAALQQGGAEFPKFAKRLMTLSSRVMTRSTYWI